MSQIRLVCEKCPIKSTFLTSDPERTNRKHFEETGHWIREPKQVPIQDPAVSTSGPSLAEIDPEWLWKEIE